MGPLDLLDHLLNFVMPAAVVGLLLAAVTPWFIPSAGRMSRLGQGLTNSLAGIVTLVCGLWFFGNDGKVVTYGAMLVVCASSQWLGSKAWK